MEKNKLHTISDEDAIEVARILLKYITPFNYEFIKINRIPYNIQDGCDSEESVNVYFKAIVKDETSRKSGWKDKLVWVQLIESNRYHDHPYFCASQKYEEEKVWRNLFLANQIEAVEFLQNKKLL